MIEEDIHDELIADGTVSGLVGTEVYVGRVLSTISFPAVQIRSTGGQLATHLIGEGAAQNRIFQLDCYAQRESDASALAKAVRDALTGSKTNFTGIGIEAPQAFYEDDYSVHRMSFEMSFWF